MTPKNDLEQLTADGGEPGTWLFAGECFMLRNKLDLRVMGWLEEGKFLRVLKAALGAEQAARLMDLDSDDAVLDERAITELMEAWAAAAGSTVGESPASTRS